MYKLWTVLLLNIFSVDNSETAFNENGTVRVIFVNLLHRHGARTPAYFYPTDPYQNLSYWPEGKGQLTNLGKQQMFELGQWLRRRYDGLLTDRYSRDLVYVQSTDFDRTLMSAECMLAGMFPPMGSQVWTEEIQWQPVPVHTTALRFDKVLGQPPRSPCPAYDQEARNVFQSDEKIKELNKTFDSFFQWVNENSGATFSIRSLYNLYDTLYIESLYNLTLPEWTKRVFPEPMLQANLYTYQVVTWTPKLARLMTGLLIGDMIEHMVDKVRNTATRNVHIYSAHDENIVNLLHALGAFNDALPPYASCVMMELSVGPDGGYYVSLYYRNSTTQDPHLLQVAGCAPVCPLDQFIAIARPLVPDDWDQECGLDDGGDVSQYSYLTIVLGAVAAVAVVILIFSIIFFLHWRKHH